MFVNCVDVDQKDAVWFSAEYGGPGLLKEVWELVGATLKLHDLCSLYLTCKTLFNMFTYEDVWFTNHHVYVYVTISKRRGYDSWKSAQDAVTEGVEDRREKLQRLFPTSSFLGFCSHNLSVINSYIEVRRLFRLLRINMEKEKLIFEGSGLEAEKYIYKLLLDRVTEHVKIPIAFGKASITMTGKLKEIFPTLTHVVREGKVYFDI